jgi:ligand-binding sensor domain-containing protein
MKLNILLFLSILTLFTSCYGQSTKQQVKTDNFVKGDSVSELGSNIMVVFQDNKNVYWFGSWDTGVYKYDGKELINYTTKHGLLNDRIDEIKEDQLGNIYFASANATSEISKFNGKSFTTLSGVPSENWELEPTDMWFKYAFGNTRKVYRYDGVTLFELQLPNPPDLPNPFEIYSIYKDRKGNIWFGTNPVGVCRYDGKSFEWITEEDVTEFRNEGANGVRSITEDKNGDFWFNTEFRYGIYDSATIESNAFYSRHKSIGGLDGKMNSDLDEYLSIVRDDNNNLWFVTYLDGVWKYDGSAITHYPVHDKSKQISLFSIYKDKNGDLWLGSFKNGVYKFNGQSFEKFKL